MFNLIGIASNALKDAGQGEKVNEMFNRIWKCGSYENAIGIMIEYVGRLLTINEGKPKYKLQLSLLHKFSNTAELVQIYHTEPTRLFNCWKNNC